MPSFVGEMFNIVIYFSLVEMNADVWRVTAGCHVSKYLPRVLITKGIFESFLTFSRTGIISLIFVFFYVYKLLK